MIAVELMVEPFQDATCGLFTSRLKKNNGSLTKKLRSVFLNIIHREGCLYHIYNLCDAFNYFFFPNLFWALGKTTVCQLMFRFLKHQLPKAPQNHPNNRFFTKELLFGWDITDLTDIFSWQKPGAFAK